MLNLLVLGDWGREGAPDQRAVAHGMAEMAERLPASLVISTGDNFYEDGVAGLDDPLWRRTFEEVYDAPALQVPWYAVLGNHDYRGSVAAQIAYTRRSPRWRMPGRYYAVTHRVDAATTAQLVFLDTTPFFPLYHPGGAEYTPGVAEQDTAAQLAWLDRTLAASTATWKIVVGHHPLYSASRFHGESPELQAVLQPRLERYGVQLYLCGHDHDLQHLCVDGVHHVLSGAGSEAREAHRSRHSRFSHGALGFAAASLSARTMRLVFCGTQGEVFYEHHVDHLHRRPAAAPVLTG